MKCKLLLKGILLCGLFTALTSCEPDDVCLPSEAPYVSINFYYPNSDTNLEDTIFYKAYINDTILIDEGDNTKDLKTLNLPIQSSNNQSITYILQQGSTYTTSQINDFDTIRTNHIAPKDTLIIHYSLDSQYNSKGCGFGLIFKDITNTNSTNWIANTEIINTIVNDATSTNLNIFAEPRNY